MDPLSPSVLADHAPEAKQVEAAFPSGKCGFAASSAIQVPLFPERRRPLARKQNRPELQRAAPSC